MTGSWLCDKPAVESVDLFSIHLIAYSRCLFLGVSVIVLMSQMIQNIVRILSFGMILFSSLVQNAVLPQLLYFPNFCTTQVRLDLTTFILEAASRGSCTYDWLTVTDTDGSTLLERWAPGNCVPKQSWHHFIFCLHCWRALQVLWEQTSLPGAAEQRFHCARNLPQWRWGGEQGVQHLLESSRHHWFWSVWDSEKSQKIFFLAEICRNH